MPIASVGAYRSAKVAETQQSILRKRALVAEQQRQQTFKLDEDAVVFTKSSSSDNLPAATYSRPRPIFKAKAEEQSAGTALENQPLGQAVAVSGPPVEIKAENIVDDAVKVHLQEGPPTEIEGEADKVEPEANAVAGESEAIQGEAQTEQQTELAAA